MAKGSVPKPDPIVGALIPDPDVPPDIVALTGYLGASPRKKHWRLYLNLALNAYLEIPENAIVHHESLSTKDAPLRGTVVWIKRDAARSVTVTTSRRASADMLEGEIARALMRGAIPFPYPPIVPWPTKTPTRVSQCEMCPTADPECNLASSMVCLGGWGPGRAR